MKKFFHILGIVGIAIFSFYYTDKIALLVQEKNPVLQKIKSKQASLEIPFVNAQIEDDYIIPGVSGSVVNVEKSFFNMKAINAYNESYIVYDEVKPEVSVASNKDKIIISGNKSKKQVSIIIEDDENLKTYFAKYDVNLLITKENYAANLGYELINNESNTKYFKQLNTLLDKDEQNKYLCLYNKDNYKICKKNQYYIVKNSLVLNNKSIIEVKNNLEAGSIILVTKNAALSDINLMLREIKFKDLKIVYLSQLIKE